MHRPAAGLVQAAQSFPAHLLPTVGLQDLESMVWDGCVLAHPVRERDVVHEQRRIVPPRHQPGCLSVSRHVKEADRDAVKAVGRRRGQHLAGRDRVSGQQHVPTVVLELERMAHHRLGGPLAPCERRSPRHRHHVVQLDALHPGLKLARDKPPRGRLASAAGTADKQEHAGIVRTGSRNRSRQEFASVSGPAAVEPGKRVRGEPPFAHLGAFETRSYRPLEPSKQRLKRAVSVGT
jgi:hypothetical protein